MYAKFRVPIQLFERALTDPASSDWLDGEIRLQHGFQSFQKADKVADALRLISSKALWNEVATILGTDQQLVKEQLNLIVNRRNQIAHEADMDPSYPDQRWPIDVALLNSTIDFLHNLATAIYRVVN
ncbi:HEPN domain-containing protein [Paenibacillus elgii]|uniref:HEPN domain-containing protein n=1 Tax=Paenibacillus elgii TaxID=189691 RepID=UPI001300C098|nr:HEPN domain-containing protein [Paenibacillus elgii]